MRALRSRSSRPASPAKSQVAYVALGSNRGGRAANLRAAIQALQRTPGVRVRRVSSFIESKPLAVRPQRDFLNCCAKIETTRSPMGLLIEFKRLERLAGRRPGLRGVERSIDIDLLLYGELNLHTPHLTVPHPLMRRRAFVLGPLRELGKMIKCV